eukprot:scaffold53365_cov18-Tisochrysis_lutea.AAC.2
MPQGKVSCGPVVWGSLRPALAHPKLLMTLVCVRPEFCVNGITPLVYACLSFQGKRSFVGLTALPMRDTSSCARDFSGCTQRV